MKETLVRGVVWHGPELVIQKATRQDGTEVYGFPGAVVLPGDRPVNVAVAALSRMLGYDFKNSPMSDATVLEDKHFEVHFVETRVPYPSLRPTRSDGKVIDLWTWDEVEQALNDDSLTKLSSQYIKQEFIDGVIDN
jgi:hypothetical protein